MPAPTTTKKQTGYLVKIEAFVPADLTDSHKLSDLQAAINRACDQFAGGAPTASLLPTRR